MALLSGEGAAPRPDDRYRRIVETAHNGIWQIADDGTTVYANPRMAEMLGVNVGELLGRSTFDFVFPEDVEKGMVYFDLRRGGDRGTFEWRFRRADGSELWTLASCHPVLDADGRFDGAAGIFSDLTAQRQAEARLRMSEERFRASVDTLLDCFGIYSAVRDEDGRIVDFRTEYLNQAACSNNRLPLEQQIGRTLLELMPNHRSSGLFDEYCRLVETGEPLSKETVFYQDDYAGERLARWFDIRATRLGDGFAAAWREVSEKKRAETELRRQHDLLKEADRRKDQFLAMLAHELRNPLAPIRNSVEILRLLGGQEPLMAQARDMIDRQVTHMSRLLDDLLDVSRVARGRIHLRRERCDLVRIVRQTAEDYRGTLEAGGLRLVLRMPDGPLPVNGDPTRLAQVVSNVLHNSGKFTEPGGAVTVVLDEAPAGMADLRIRDTGIGMEPEMVDRAFDTFSQAEGGLDRSRGGLGLGLALVKGLVELHGGTVAASSPGPGQGTEIAVRLPLEPASSGQPPR